MEEILFKNLLTNKSYDKLLLNVEGTAFGIMIFCVLVFFPIIHFFPKFKLLIVSIFLIAGIIGFSIFLLWKLRDFKDFKDHAYPLIFEAREKEREQKKGKKDERRANNEFENL